MFDRMRGRPTVRTGAFCIAALAFALSACGGGGGLGIGIAHRPASLGPPDRPPRGPDRLGRHAAAQQFVLLGLRPAPYRDLDLRRQAVRRR